MRLVIGSDHGGLELKEELRVYLLEQGHEVVDLGVGDDTPADYPPVGREAAAAVSRGEFERGLLVCGSGIGMSIVANRFPGVRAALCHDVYTAQLSREHNDANILVLGGRIVGKGLAREILRVWLSSAFQGGRHQRRIDQIRSLDEELAARPLPSPHKSVHGSTSSPRTEDGTLAVPPEPFDSAQDRPVEGRTANCDTLPPGRRE